MFNLSQPGTGDHVFSCFSFFILIITFVGLKISIPFLSPFSFFHCFFIPVFLPFGIFIFLSFASKMVVGPWELPPGAFSRTLLVSFHATSFLYRFGYFSFLCLENCPWKLSRGAFSRTLFVFVSCFFSCWHVFWQFFRPLPSKLTLEIVKTEHFSRTLFLSFFFVLAILPPLPSKLTLEIVQRSFFSNPFRYFFRCFFVSFFTFVLLRVFSFHCSFSFFISFFMSFSFSLFA